MGITDSTLKKIRATVQAAQEKTAGKEQEVSDVCTAAEKLVAHTVAHRVLCEKTKNPASLATRLLGVPLRLGSLQLRWSLMTGLAGAIDRLLEEPDAPAEEEPPPDAPGAQEPAEESAEEPAAEEPAAAPAEEPAVQTMAEAAPAVDGEEEGEEEDEDEEEAYDGDLSALEFIDVTEQPERYREMLEQERRGEVRLINRYRRSFRSRLIQSQGNVQEYYSALKNALRSYKGVKGRVSWSYESFNRGRMKLAKINAKTRTLYLYLALDPAQLQDSKYFFEDVSDIKKYAEVPVLFKIKGERKFRQALELIEKLCGEQAALPPVKDFEAQDYTLPYQNTVTLVQEGLVRQYTAAVPVEIPAEPTFF